MKTIALGVAFAVGFSIAGAAVAAEPTDTIRIYGAPLARVRSLSAKVSRVKTPAPLIIVHFEGGFTQEASETDFLRWLSRDTISPVDIVTESESDSSDRPVSEEPTSDAIPR